MSETADSSVARAAGSSSSAASLDSAMLGSGRVGFAVWLLRIVWLLQPLALVQFLDRAAATATGGGRVLVAVAAWAAWAAALLATLVPSTVSLTVGRAIAPVGVVAVVVGALGGSVAGWRTAVALAAALIGVLVWFSGESGGAMAQGSAYGAEQRFPLKPPVPYIAPVVVTWLITCGCAVAGIVALSHASWIVGGLSTALAVGLGVLAGPRFHQLSRRWFVVVPVGIVVHDPLLLVENALFLTAKVAALHLAPAGTEAADLTGGTAGVVIEIVLRETETVVKTGGRDSPRGVALHVRSVLISPTRPGRALAAAALRKLPVG